MEKDETKKEELKKALIETSAPKYMGKINEMQGKNGGTWLVGKYTTWADSWIAYCLDFIEMRVGAPISNYPNLKKMREAFYSIPQIKEYVANRPADTQ